MHVTLNGCVAIRCKMLTYSVYAALLNRIDASPLNVFYYFCDGLSLKIQKNRFKGSKGLPPAEIYVNLNFAKIFYL